jgi:uncharacterized protein
MSNKDSLLWRLEAPGGTTHFLFGTMHTRSALAHAFLAGVEPCLSEVEILATEYDLTDSALHGFSGVSTPPGYDLLTALGAKKYEKCRRMIFKATDIDLQRLRFLHPFLVQSLIDASFFSEDHALALDQALAQIGAERGLTSAGLETFERQLAIINQVPIEESVRQLWFMSRHISRHRRHLLKMMEWYQDQRIQQLYLGAKRGLGNHRRLFLYDRNRRMAESLVDLAAEHSVFAAVGAAHLGGEHGILAQLKRANWRLRPMLLNTSRSGTV